MPFIEVIRIELTGLVGAKEFAYVFPGTTVKIRPEPADDDEVYLYYITIPTPLVNASDAFPLSPKMFQPVCLLAASMCTDVIEGFDQGLFNKLFGQYTAVMDDLKGIKKEKQLEGKASEEAKASLVGAK